MPKKNAKSKRFANKAEEAAWWEKNAELLADEFEKSIAVGRARRAVLVVTGDSSVAKIRMSAKDMVLARAQAKERGVRCQEYLNSILQEKLRKTDAGIEPTNHE
jgi:predicted DNA binding CopG/RHH family protein